jgi:hypothetical protein
VWMNMGKLLHPTPLCPKYPWGTVGFSTVSHLNLLWCCLCDAGL